MDVLERLSVLFKVDDPTILGLIGNTIETQEGLAVRKYPTEDIARTVCQDAIINSKNKFYPGITFFVGFVDKINPTLQIITEM